jgi:Fe-S-cluster containining protein
MIETLEDMGGQVLEPGRKFNFQCHPDLACFGSCCRDKRLPLMPYDALRLRRALGLSSSEFLAGHTELEADPRSGWPVLRIKLTAQGLCPYVDDGACRVYAHRPTCCRIYPVVRAVSAPGGPVKEVFLRQETKGCLGWDQPRPLTPEQWLQDQDLGEYLKYNDRLAGLIMHPRRKGKVKLNQRQTHAFIAALYNLDMFGQMVRQPDFGERFGLPPSRVEAALAQEEELILLGLAWLIGQLFGG